MAKGGSRAHAGRKPKPRELKVLQGTFREDRHGHEVQVEPKWPDPPEFLRLTDEQRAIWDSLKDRDAWHAESDWPAVYGLVRTLDELIRNQAAQAETDTSNHPLAFKHVVKTAAGADGPVELEYVMAEGNPLKSEARKFLDQLYKYAAINGYSPVDRGKMPSGADNRPADPLDKFLSRKRG